MSRLLGNFGGRAPSSETCRSLKPVRARTLELSCRDADGFLDYLEEVDVFTRGPAPSRAALHQAGQAHRVDQPAVGISNQEGASDLVLRVRMVIWPPYSRTPIRSEMLSPRRVSGRPRRSEVSEFLCLRRHVESIDFDEPAQQITRQVV